MSYKILGNKLRVSEEIARESRDILSSGRLILLQHLLDDTYEFTTHLKSNGAIIDTIWQTVLRFTHSPCQLTKDKVNVSRITYNEIERNNQLLDC